MSSMLIVGLKYPENYGFLSLSTKSVTVYRKDIKKYKENLINCLFSIEDENVFKYFVYIKDIITHNPKKYVKILDKLLLEMGDPLSKFSQLDTFYKDIITLSKLDYELRIDSNRTDQMEFIKKYEKFLGVHIVHNLVFDNSESKLLSIMIMGYRQIISLYQGIIDKDLNQGLNIEQKAHLYMISKRVTQLEELLHSSDPTDEEFVKNSQILMTYFMTYRGNRFADPDKIFYPRCPNVKPK